MSPGAVAPGVIGAICLLLALYGLQLLPVNYAGLALIILGIAFMIAEAFLPSFGVVGLGGVAAFVAGALILIDTELPDFGIPVGADRHRRRHQRPADRHHGRRRAAHAAGAPS